MALVDLRGDVYLGTWTRIPATGPGSIRNAAGVQITRGRPNESATMSPSQASLTLDNRDFRWTIRNPAGPWYGSIGQNTPLRLSVPAAAAGLPNYLRLETDETSTATTPDSAGLQITGVLDVRVDCQLTDYQPSVLAAKWGGTAKSWMFVLDSAFCNFMPSVNFEGTAALGFYWWDGAAVHGADSGQGIPAYSPGIVSGQPGTGAGAGRLPAYGQRLALRVVFTPSTGTVQFYTAPTMAGAWTQLGNTVTLGATTLANGAGQAVQIGGTITQATPPFVTYVETWGSLTGSVYEAQILAAAVVKADPVFSSQAAGATSFADGQGNTWTLNGTAEISDRLYRFHGELGSLPKAADPAQRDVSSAAAAYGISQRLQNSNTPLHSPLYRYYARAPAGINLGAYWPGEDGTGATSIGSALGQQPLTINGSPQLASFSGFACSSPIAVMNGATFTGNISAPGVTWTDVSARFLLAVPAGGETNGTVLAQAFYTGGSFAQAQLTYTTGGFLGLATFNTAGALIATTGNISFGVDGQLLVVAMDLKKNGTGTDMTIEVLNVGLNAAGGIFTHTVASSTPGTPTQVVFGAHASAMGHFSVQGTVDTIFDLMGVLNAWQAEPAAARFARLCAEEGIPCRIIGSQAASMPMGAQPVDTLINILQQCEQTDLGMMFEPRQVLGIGYRTRSSMYNQAPVCTLNFATPGSMSQGFTSTSDTQLAVNDVTATAPDGSTGRQFLAGPGPMSVQAPPNGISRVDTQISPSPWLDSALNQIAAWYLSLRSVNDDRYPAIPLNMTRATTPVTAALLDVGDYLKITGTPAWLPPPPVSQLYAGATETIGPQPQWMIAVNGIPELPYETAQFGPSHFDTAGSTVHAGATYGAATFQADTSTGPLWTTAAGDYPLDLVIAGQQITVSACSGTSGTQTFTVSAWGVNGVQNNLLAGQSISLYRKPVYAL